MFKEQMRGDWGSGDKLQLPKKKVNKFCKLQTKTLDNKSR